jgi:hypothetical protein
MYICPFASFLQEINTVKKGLFMPKQTKLPSKGQNATKAIPIFKTEEAGRKFWGDAANDATEYFDASTMQVSKFTNLKPTSKT